IVLGKSAGLPSWLTSMQENAVLSLLHSEMAQGLGLLALLVVAAALVVQFERYWLDSELSQARQSSKNPACIENELPRTWNPYSASIGLSLLSLLAGLGFFATIGFFESQSQGGIIICRTSCQLYGRDARICYPPASPTNDCSQALSQTNTFSPEGIDE